MVLYMTLCFRCWIRFQQPAAAIVKPPEWVRPVASENQQNEMKVYCGITLCGLPVCNICAQLMLRSQKCWV